MVARVDGLDGGLIGVHRTWLDRGADGIWHRCDRASLGPTAGGAVRLGPLDPDRALIVGEVRATADAVSSRVAAALNAGSTTPAEVIKLPKRG